MPNNSQPATNNRRTYLVTGVAGFIASKVAEQLLAAGHTVVGLDNLNDYYDVRLKLYRLARLAELAGLPAGADPRAACWWRKTSFATPARTASKFCATLPATTARW